MSNLEELHTAYINAKDTYAKGIADIHQKAEKIGGHKRDIADVKSRIIEVERTLNNARKGIDRHVSAEEFSLLTDELEDKKKKLQNLNDLLPIHEIELNGLNQQSMKNSRYERGIINQITDAFINEAASDVVIAVDSKLKELMYAILSKYELNFTGRQDQYDDFYKKIGEKLCNQIFTTDTGWVALPTAKEAVIERDKLIHGLVNLG